MIQLLSTTSDHYDADKDKEVEDIIRTSLEESTGYLREFTWQQPTISIGKNQSSKQIISELPVIRRSTGGNAIFLDGSELSCTLFIKSNERIKNIFKAVNNIIGVWLSNIIPGITTVVVGTADEYKSVECFNTTYAGEYTVGGKKLLGTAASMVNGVYTQHVVMYITNSYEQLSKYTKENSKLYNGRITCLQELDIKREKNELFRSLARAISNGLVKTYE